MKKLHIFFIVNHFRRFCVTTTNKETRVIFGTIITNVTTVAIGIMLTVAATTKITIQKAKLAVINARRSSKYKIKYMIFFSVTEQNSKTSTNFGENHTNSKFHENSSCGNRDITSGEGQTDG